MDAIVKTERDVWIHGYLLHTSKCLLEKGQANEAGSHHQFLGSLMFSAFGFEAYLNWLGSELNPDWECIERSLEPEAKFDRLAAQLNVVIDRTRRPGQTLKLLFRFRNTIAHGKRDPNQPLQAKTVEKRYTTDGFPEFIKTDWESFSDPRNVEQVNGDIRTMIESLHAKSGLDCDPFSFGSQTRSALFIPEDHRHLCVKLAKPELLEQERKSYEVDGWTFHKRTYSADEGFGAIFIQPKRNRAEKQDT